MFTSRSEYFDVKPHQKETSPARTAEVRTSSSDLPGRDGIGGELTINGESGESWPCLIWSIAPGRVTAITAKAVAVGSQIHVPGRFSGEVTHCSAGEAGFKIVIRLSDNDGVGNRHDPRFAVEALGSLSLVGSSGLVREEIEVVDISATGMGIRIRPELEPGRIVMIELKTGVVFGEVRHCTPEATGWHRVGIALETKQSPLYFASHFIWKLRMRPSEVGEE